MSSRNVAGALGFALAGAALVVACSSSSSSTGNDAPSDAGVDAAPPCGKPGERGNEIGVGHFCNSTGDCSNAGKASVCATFLDPREHFCSMLCAGDGGPSQCGSDAVCVCQSHICGCVPTACAEDAGLL